MLGDDSLDDDSLGMVAGQSIPAECQNVLALPSLRFTFLFFNFLYDKGRKHAQ